MVIFSSRYSIDLEQSKYGFREEENKYSKDNLLYVNCLLNRTGMTLCRPLYLGELRYVTVHCVINANNSVLVDCQSLCNQFNNSIHLFFL